ncbi:MAG: arginase family protein, partial [bacterium]
MSYFEVEPKFLRDPKNLKLKEIAVFSKDLSLKNLNRSLENYKRVLGCEPVGVNIFLGIGWDGSTAGRPGARFSPQKIIEKFLSLNLNHSYKKSIFVAPYAKVIIGDKKKTFKNISKTVEKILEIKNIKNLKFFIGGDHSITFPIVDQYLNFYQELNLVVFDTHFDLRILDEGLSGGTYLQELKNKHANRLNVLILGIKDLANPEYLYTEAKKYEIKYLTNLEIMQSFEKVEKFLDGNLYKNKPVYISFDIDSMDIAYVDSVNSPYSFGFRIEEVYKIVSYLKDKYEVVGMDLVEFNPLVG